MTAKDRFWAKVLKSDSCWFWMGGRQQRTHDYGCCTHNGRRTYALCVCHSCDNPPCVNPAHLLLGTQADNMRDMAHRGRAATAPRRSHRIRPVTTHRSSRFGHGKLTERDVKQIRESYGPDCSQSALAKKYNVSQQNIATILLRQTWRHV